MKIIDISTPLSERMPVWPETPHPRFTLISSMRDGDCANDTKVEMSIHSGAHIDAPSHFLAGGKSIDKIPLETFIGPVFVAYLPKVKKISSRELMKLKIPNGITRVLFKTSNSSLWKKPHVFRKDYVGLTEDAARWIAERHLKLVGVDYLSVADFSETAPVHKVLLKRGIALLEGLDLREAREGVYQLIALPLFIPNAEAAPTRAVLLPHTP